VQRSLCGTTPNVGRPHGREIGIAHGADIIGGQLDERLRLPGQSNEFDVDRLFAVHVDHCAQIPAPKSMLREIAFKDDSIEFVNAHAALAGYAVIRRGEAPSEGMSQTVTTGKGVPFGPRNCPVPAQRSPNALV